MTIKKAYHGGAFFNSIGNDFSKLEKSKEVINADVLDAWFDPTPKAILKLKKYLSWIVKTSPPTRCEGLIDTISKYRKIPKENILVGGGSSDLMFTFFPNILQKKESVLILDPMYGEYAHIFENITKTKIIRYQLESRNNFCINYNSLVKKIKTENPCVIMLTNPNSPTGQYWEKSNIVNLIKEFPDKLFVVDETYIEYIGKQFSLEQEAIKNNNLVIIKSMSKVYALSGARVGYLVANRDITEKISQIIPPWSVSLVGQICAVEALKDEEYYLIKYNETQKLRKKMMNSLKDVSSIKLYDSVANFFLIELIDKKLKADAIVNALREKNVFIRNCNSMSKQFHNNFIRIAVKDDKSNKKIIKELKNLI
jgi:histidinol-phosphate aminotransferase